MARYTVFHFTWLGSICISLVLSSTMQPRDTTVENETLMRCMSILKKQAGYTVMKSSNMPVLI
jgi:hypothetical protein